MNFLQFVVRTLVLIQRRTLCPHYEPDYNFLTKLDIELGE